MPLDNSIKKVLMIGSGPIQIGQGCEFDYSGTQACKALKDENIKVILINSNPATIMTDPETADKVYIEPITYKYVIQIIEKEKPDAILATMGGQAALNILTELDEKGDLEKYNLKAIGVKPRTVKLAEDREEFKKLVENLGYETPKGDFVNSQDQADQLLKTLSLNFPVIIRASYTLGGAGGGIAYNQSDYEKIVKNGLKLSPINELLIEESILGWKEYELEVMQDQAENFVVICGVENVNPVGVHTGDSITIAPCMTLTDVEYQKLRDISKEIFKEIGVESGGANIQFAIHPNTGRIIIIEMNPRVSRSSALVSKATGYPIARISAKLALGYYLNELDNEITGFTTAAFEPVIDYVALKIPRWDFAKFPDADHNLGIQMKSVGEVLAFGRSFKDAFQKAWRSLEIGLDGWTSPEDEDLSNISIPTEFLFFAVKEAFVAGKNLEEIYEETKISKWFLNQLYEIVELEDKIKKSELSADILLDAKKDGFSNKQISLLTKKSESEIRNLLNSNSIKPTFKMVDTCSAEFEALTPYYFKTYESKNDNLVTNKKKVVILGSGPNRIGQGIEFDYSCVHAVQAYKESGFETIMINCNPETISTDYNTSDKLYIEPLMEEDVLDILNEEKPDGVVIQFGGQTPLKLARAIKENGFTIFGTDYAQIELAENRKEFGKIIKELDLKAPEFGTVFTYEEAKILSKEIGYPVLVRPSYVLGGRGMKIVYDEKNLEKYILLASEIDRTQPILIDKFLDHAIEIDVDALSDGSEVFVAGIMQHIEEAGIHSGDSSCSLPPFSVSSSLQKEIEEITTKLALKLGTIGLINIQFAIYKDEIYLIEVNPRSSRTVPFVSKSISIPLAKIAAKLTIGKKLSELNLVKTTKSINIKSPVFPHSKFTDSNPYLGPEMTSIGEVMGKDISFGKAYIKSLIASGHSLPHKGSILITVRDTDKAEIIPIAQLLSEIGYNIYTTAGTNKELKANGIPSTIVYKHLDETNEMTTVNAILTKDVFLIINTPDDEYSRMDEQVLGKLAIEKNILFTSSISAARAITKALITNQLSDSLVYPIN